MSVRSAYIGAPTFTLPTAVGSAAQVLTSNGDGSTDWAEGGGGGGVSEIKAGANITLTGIPTVVTVNMPILPITGPLAGQVVGFSGAPSPTAPLTWVDSPPTTVTAGDNITISAANVVAMPIAGTQIAGYIVGFGGDDDALTWVEPTQPTSTVSQPTLVMGAGINFGAPTVTNITTLTLNNLITILPGTEANESECSTATNDFLITYEGFISAGTSYLGSLLYMGMVWNATQLSPIFGTWSFAGSTLSFQSMGTIAIAENDIIEAYPPQLSYTTNNA